MNRKQSISVYVIAGITLIVTLLYIDMHTTLHKPLSLEKDALFILEKGSTIRSLRNKLVDAGLLDSPRYFMIWSRVFDLSSKLKAGEYRVRDGDSVSDILDKVVRGRVEQYKLTLVEGKTFTEMLKTIHQHPQIISTLKPSDESIMKTLGVDIQHLEGQFYPDTYYIHKGTTDVVLLKRAYHAMQEILQEEWAKRAVGLPFKTPYEALILASIVEKESAVPEERAIIAGVFINRLRKGMRLQTDPTVIYGMGESFDGDIRFRDLKRDTPYNTYTRNGLPPTPIAMPGREAIHAVMHPEETEALYFVAFGDGSGRHYFSDNLKDHEAAVNKYQKKR